MDKLSKLSDKELKTLLVSDFYKAKYFKYGIFILEVIYKLNSTWIFRDIITNKIYSIKFFDIKSSCSVFDFEEWKNYRIKEKRKSIFKQFKDLSSKIKFLAKIVELSHKGEYEITSDNSYIEIVLHYPELTITNSLGLEHKLNSVFVKYVLSGDMSNLIRIKLARTTYTELEYNAQYIFSHCLHTRELGNWVDEFCYGESIQLKNIINKCSDGDIFSLKYLILMFKEYLCWESLEGKPYAYISGIKSKKYERVYPTIEPKKLNLAYTAIFKKLASFLYTFTGDPIRLELSKDSVDIIDDILTEEYPELCYYIIDGEDHIKKKQIDTELVSSNIIFKGDIVPITILKEEIEEDTTPKKISRDLLNMVVYNLEEEFLEFLINNK
jgi:hypothetical protein